MVLFADDTITLFNRIVDDETGKLVYIPHVLKGNLVETKGANISTSGMTDADSCKLFLPIENYVPPIEWQKLTEEEQKLKYTATPQTDFFVKGNLSEIVQSYGFFESVKENYDGVYVVTNCDIYRNVLPHLEIWGR